MLEKELENIILKEKKLIPFLQKLSPKDKRDLVPFLKEFHKKITEIKFVEEKSGRYTSYSSVQTHSDKQRELIDLACFVCLNKTDIKRTLFNASNLAVDDYYLENVIPWYQPKWYSNLINEDIPWGLHYEKMMRLHEEGLIELSHEIIINKLPNAIVQSRQVNKKHTNFYSPEILELYKETLEDHIWFLFEEESTINNYYNYLHLENFKGGNDVWIHTIFNLTSENKIDRKRVLIATIYTATKGFNKTLSGWFFDLLTQLAPTLDEVLSLQDEFFTTLHSPHSKVVNTTLKYFKLVANQKKFKYKAFIDNASILLNSETKSVINSTLMILDKIAKTHKSSSTFVSMKASEALINSDEKIQLRAAKIIEKYGNSKKQELLDEINLYAETIFHSSKEILREYIIAPKEVEEIRHEIEEIEILSEHNKIPAYKSLDDLIFFVSQSIDNNEVYHIDLLLSLLPKLSTLITKDNVAKLEPIFKRSFDLSMSYDLNSQIGNLEREACYYINDFAEILMKQYPEELINFRKTKNQKVNNLKQQRYFGEYFENKLKQIELQHIPDYIYQIHHSLFLKSKSHIKKGLTLGLLSTPTHIPCWIDPTVLINRIVSYEKQKEEINLYDFQIAVGRLPINESPEKIHQLIDKINDAEIKKVLQYQFDLLDIKNADISRPELWLQGLLSKNRIVDIHYFEEKIGISLQKERGSYDWDCKLRDHFYKEYDYAVRKQVEKKITKKELNFKDFHFSKNKSESIFSNIIGVFSKKKKRTKISSIYEYMYFKKQKYYTTIQPNDDVKFLFLSPNNPSMFLSHVIHNNLKESTFFDESSKKNMVHLLKGLHQIWYRSDLNESTYLFLATGFLCSHKVARELAAEVWIKANSEEKMNNKLLGQILGKLESGEYAPIKRFTDLLVASIFNASKFHNQHLFTLIDYMISNMDDASIRGIKKLLELFIELKYNLQAQISQLSKEKLSEWNTTKTLKPIISKLIS